MPLFSNVCLSTLVPISPDTTMPNALDAITIYTILSTAMKRYLGLIGSSFQLDILQSSTLDNIVIRVPSKDFDAAWGALSAYNVDTNVPASMGGGAKVVDGCAKLGVSVIRTGEFLAGVVGPTRKWVPPVRASNV